MNDKQDVHGLSVVANCHELLIQRFNEFYDDFHDETRLTCNHVPSDSELNLEEDINNIKKLLQKKYLFDG